MTQNTDGMLGAYRAIDLSDEKGLICGKVLADLGADVIKIERPGGDPARKIGPFYHDEPDPEKSLFWFAFNTSKRGITLDIESADGQGLRSVEIETLQVNLGLRCNQRCAHCHVNASPSRTEMMDWNTIQNIIKAARQVRPKLIDITGGAPELNPNLSRIIEALRKKRFHIQVRTNLTVLLEPGLVGVDIFVPV